MRAILPHRDFSVAHELTAPGAAARSFFASTGNLGEISLRGQLDLERMLQPTIQEGSKLGWEYPTEQVSIVLSAARPFTFTLGGQVIEVPRAEIAAMKQLATSLMPPGLDQALAPELLRDLLGFLLLQPPPTSPPH